MGNHIANLPTTTTPPPPPSSSLSLVVLALGFRSISVLLECGLREKGVSHTQHLFSVSPPHIKSKKTKKSLKYKTQKKNILCPLRSSCSSGELSFLAIHLFSVSRPSYIWFYLTSVSLHAESAASAILREREKGAVHKCGDQTANLFKYVYN